MLVFYVPKHPYTWGLLSSMTRLDGVQAARLHSIRGAPPSVINLPHGCRFRPRCDFAVEICGQQLPIIEAGKDGRFTACHRKDELDLAAIIAEDRSA